MSDAEAPVYLHAPPGRPLPDLSHLAPYRAVVVAETPAPPDWQHKVSKWLVLSGCLYVMAWGEDSNSWDDSVDMAMLDLFNHDDVPEDRFVMTTWYTDEPLKDVLAFCKALAVHPVVELKRTLLLHIAEQSDEARLLAAYSEV